MHAKTFPVLCLVLLAGFAPLSMAATQSAGEFTCPAGQTENIQCAATCCSQYGGTYSYADQTCEVASAPDWSSVAQCEQQSGCCESAGNANHPASSSSSGCCGPAFLLGMVVVGAFVTSGKSN